MTKQNKQTINYMFKKKKKKKKKKNTSKLCSTRILALGNLIRIFR